MITKYLKQFFLFLLPIVKQAVAQVAADELAKVAYKTPRPKFIDYSKGAQPTFERPRILPEENERIVDGAIDADWSVRTTRHNVFATTEGFHDVLMVAFDIKGFNADQVHEWLALNMPETGRHWLAKENGAPTTELYLDSWWIADDGAEGDLDSAVFVAKGNQKLARELLRAHGLVH